MPVRPASMRVVAPRPASHTSSSPMTSVDTEIASHSASRPIQPNPFQSNRVWMRRVSPPMVAPGATTGASRVTTSPLMLALSRSSTRPLNTFTSPLTWPEIVTGPSKTVTEPLTVPATVADPWNTTRSLTSSSAGTSARPDRTTNASGSRCRSACAHAAVAGTSASRSSSSPRTTALRTVPSKWSADRFRLPAGSTQHHRDVPAPDTVLGRGRAPRARAARRSGCRRPGSARVDGVRSRPCSTCCRSVTNCLTFAPTLRGEQSPKPSPRAVRFGRFVACPSRARAVLPVQPCPPGARRTNWSDPVHVPRPTVDAGRWDAAPSVGTIAAGAVRALTALLVVALVDEGSAFAVPAGSGRPAALPPPVVAVGHTSLNAGSGPVGWYEQTVTNASLVLSAGDPQVDDGSPVTAAAGRSLPAAAVGAGTVTMRAPAGGPQAPDRPAGDVQPHWAYARPGDAITVAAEGRRGRPGGPPASQPGTPAVAGASATVRAGRDAAAPWVVPAGIPEAPTEGAIDPPPESLARTLPGGLRKSPTGEITLEDGTRVLRTGEVVWPDGTRILASGVRVRPDGIEVPAEGVDNSRRLADGTSVLVGGWILSPTARSPTATAPTTARTGRPGTTTPASPSSPTGRSSTTTVSSRRPRTCSSSPTARSSSPGPTGWSSTPTTRSSSPPGGCTTPACGTTVAGSSTRTGTWTPRARPTGATAGSPTSTATRPIRAGSCGSVTATPSTRTASSTPPTRARAPSTTRRSPRRSTSSPPSPDPRPITTRRRAT